MTIDYAELKRLAEAATPGPWSARTDDLCYAVTALGRFRIIVGSAPADDPEPDALFIAAANPATILALIAEIEQLSAQVATLQGDPNSWQSGYDEGRRMGTKTALSERDQLKAEVEALRGIMAAVVSEIPHAKHMSPGNAPGHCHRLPGVWDEDNGAKAGKECGWCKVWNKALVMSKGVAQ
ncbi:ead/Ea22-like family protein [Pseudomonas typographi]|uniref:Ead/Ea22-like family protein n=1 Tax=Pseudomonas typographi TaxID=2715964 RepID=A0ABR7ZAA5_9PSED|nr:ead/Ea22-like family protein [Pseudomonas typographi]MBD1602355.1 hypothetical protein [Pseudomonas typographi]